MEERIKLVLLLLVVCTLTLIGYALADTEQPKPSAGLSTTKVETVAASATLTQSQDALPAAKVNVPSFDPLKYTLGPDDVVEITVMRHPEFSGTYPINQEGKLQYKFVGDMDVNGMNKLQLEEKVKKVLAAYLVSPEVNVTVTDFKSKFVFVFGEVGQPGKYYMRSEGITIRDAVVAAGLPTFSAAMRRCRLITPLANGKQKFRYVDLYSVLYLGDLRRNIDMHPGEVLYVPSTVMAKVIRVVNPVTSAIGVASSGPASANEGKQAVTTFAK